METKVEIAFLKEDIFQIKTEASGATLYVDKKKENDQALGPNPLELFLSALAGCIAVYAKRYLDMHAIKYSKINIKANANFSQSSPVRLADIKVEVHTDADLGDKREVFLRFIHNCPVHNTILHTKEVDIELV
jgi:uncharacterized OsmC-like protein